MSANTYRLSARERAEQKLERSKPANVRSHPKARLQKKVRTYKGLVGGFLLLPLGLVTAFTLVEVFFRAMTRAEFWRSDQFVFFTTGGIAWAVSYLAGWRPIHAYVLGHELSHLIVARAFGGEIFGWSASPSGGYVETNKSNTWITLAPYLIPFYSMIVMIVFGLLGMFWNLHDPFTLPIGRGVVLRPVWLFYAALGLTWWFHATYTVKTVLTHQSDLERNGEFFSMSLIFLINILLITALYLSASPAPAHEFIELGRCWLGTVAWAFSLIRQVFA
ncbi:MAG: hypothetical protein V4662_19700 [Verrucomicrobiota bacterium]